MPLLALALAALFTEVYGAFEGAAAMGGASLGAVGGLVLGAGIGVWLVLRQGGKHAAVAALALSGAAVLAVVGFVLIAFD